MKKESYHLWRKSAVLICLSLLLTTAACHKDKTEGQKEQKEQKEAYIDGSFEFVGKTGPTTQTDKMIEGIAPFANMLIDREYAKGYVAAAVTPEGISYKGFGSLANVEHPEELNFQLASITKVFTGMAFASMILDGTLKNDALLTDCMPEEYMTDKVLNKISGITLEQLATHSAGFPMDMPGIINDSPEFYSDVTTNDIWKSLANAKIATSGKNLKAYSNYGVTVLGAALAYCDGEKTWADVVAKRVTGPLGLEMKPKLPTTTGYDWNLAQMDPWSWESLDGGAHAAMTGNAKNLARLAQLTLSNENYYGNNMVNMSQLPLIDNDVAGNNQIGYNWFIGYHNTLNKKNKEIFDEMIWHTGGSRTHQTFLFISPQTNNALILLGNTQTTSIDYYVIYGGWLNIFEDTIADVLLEEYLPEIVIAPIELEKSKKDRLVGKYSLGGLSSEIINITMDDEDNLWLEFDFTQFDFESEPSRIWPQSELEFFDHRGLSYAFKLNDEGQVTELSWGDDKTKVPMIKQ